VSVGDEPWRERPPSSTRCLTPGAPQGSFTPRLPAVRVRRCGTRPRRVPARDRRASSLNVQRTTSSKCSRRSTAPSHVISTTVPRRHSGRQTAKRAPGEHTIVSDANGFGRDERGRIRRACRATIFATIDVLRARADVEWHHSVTAHALQGAMRRTNVRRRAHPPARSRPSSSSPDSRRLRTNQIRRRRLARYRLSC
jgi:hypothetical protein